MEKKENYQYFLVEKSALPGAIISTHTCHTSHYEIKHYEIKHYEIKSHRIWPIWKAIPIKIQISQNFQTIL